ncbi:unnamed protein product, partial [Closterium sp. Naga37s-1]
TTCTNPTATVYVAGRGGSPHTRLRQSKAPPSPPSPSFPTRLSFVPGTTAPCTKPTAIVYVAEGGLLTPCCSQSHHLSHIVPTSFPHLSHILPLPKPPCPTPGTTTCTKPTTTVYVAQGGLLTPCCGQSTQQPCGSLQAALNSASEGATIHVASGTYTHSSPAPLLLPHLRLSILGPPLHLPPATIDCSHGPCFQALCSGTSSPPSRLAAADPSGAAGTGDAVATAVAAEAAAEAAAAAAAAAVAAAAAGGAAVVPVRGEAACRSSLITISRLQVVNGRSKSKGGCMLFQGVTVALRQGCGMIDEALRVIGALSPSTLCPPLPFFLPFFSPVLHSPPLPSPHTPPETSPSLTAMPPIPLSPPLLLPNPSTSVSNSPPASTYPTSDITLSNCHASESGGGIHISSAPQPVTLRHSSNGQYPTTCPHSTYLTRLFSTPLPPTTSRQVAGRYPTTCPPSTYLTRPSSTPQWPINPPISCRARGGACTSTPLLPPPLLTAGVDSPTALPLSLVAGYILPLPSPSSPPHHQSSSGGAISDYMSTFNVSHTAFLHSSVVYQPIDFMSGAGGCVHLNTTAVASFAHCRFAHCSSPLTGGGVSFFQGEVKPQFHNTTFEFNEALIQGGGIELVMMNGPANVTDCTFRSNRVTNGPSFGAAILSFGVPMRVERSYFWRNVAINTLPPGSQAATYLTQGGAIAANMFMDATVPYDIIDCTFVENQGGQGGALYVDTGHLQVLNCLFLRNGDHSECSLGGASESHSPASVVLVTRTLPNNCTLSPYAAHPSLVHAPPPRAPTRRHGGSAGREQHIRGQQGREDQGTGAVRVESSTFVGNRAEQSKGGALYSESVSVTFDNVTLDGNKAALQGGAVAVYASSSDGLPTEALFKSYRFVRNEAVLGGGVIYSWWHQPSLPCSTTPSPSLFVYASSSDGLPTEALFKSCRFVRNEAVLGGGAIYTGLGMRTRVHACEVEENNSTGLGGAVLVQEFSRNEPSVHPAIYTGLGMRTRVHACEVEESNSTGLGGAVLVQEFSRVEMTRTRCQGNIALTGGACLSLLANAHATVTDSILSANHGTSEGGAARVSGSAHLSLLYSSILQNTAAWGGAVWVEMGASLLISNDSKLEGNEARYLGGTVYATHVSRVEVGGGSVFRGNSALHGGAMVAEAEARVTAADSTFENNTFSGILFQGFSQGVLRNCSFTRNSNAAGRGGAVLVGDKTTVAVHSCSFSGNWAALGGAVSTEGSPYLTINGSDFTRNIAQIGAGVALAGATAFTMGESVFIKNNATKAGGGVAVLEQAEGDISGSRFEGNYAVVGGAGVYLMRSAAATAAAAGGNRPPRVRLQGLLFDGNSAMDAHGVAFFDASYSPHLRSACQACQMVQQGDTEGSMPADFYLKWPGAAMSSQETGGSFSVVGSVGSMLTGLQVVVVDEFGNIVSKDNSALARVSPDSFINGSLRGSTSQGGVITVDNSALARVSPDSRISGSLRGTSQGGIITVPPIAVRVPPGGALQPIALTVTVSSTTNAFPDFSHPFNISFCPAGQYFDGETLDFPSTQVPLCLLDSPLLPLTSGQGMETCPDGTFTFFPNAASQKHHHLIGSPPLTLSPSSRPPSCPPRITPSLSPPSPLRCAPGQGMETCPDRAFTFFPNAPSMQSGQGMETCPDGTFTFFPNAVSQEQCTACDDDSLDCRYGTLEVGVKQHRALLPTNAVLQQQCTACDDGSLDLDCRSGTLQISYQNWLDPASLNRTPATYACLLTVRGMLWHYLYKSLV